MFSGWRQFRRNGRSIVELPDFESRADGQSIAVRRQSHRSIEAVKMCVDLFGIRSQQHELPRLIGRHGQRQIQLRANLREASRMLAVRLNGARHGGFRRSGTGRDRRWNFCRRRGQLAAVALTAANLSRPKSAGELRNRCDSRVMLEFQCLDSLLSARDCGEGHQRQPQSAIPVSGIQGERLRQSD